jgi:PEP-CTERM motif-containing protein
MEFIVKFAVGLFLSFALSLAGVASSQAAFINFDDLVASTYYTSPTDVSTRYSALGVTFSDPAGPFGAVAGLTSSNVLMANQHQTTDAGDLRLDFSVPVTSVTFDFNPFFFGPSALHVLAFDSGNNLIGTFDFAQGPVTAAINTSVDIDYLLLAAHPVLKPQTFDNVTIDNLSFGVSAVPEPSTWAMLLIGFAGIGLVSYRIRERRAVINLMSN